MNDDRLLREVRARRILYRVGTGESILMPCSEMRVATRLVQRGYLILRDPKRRDMTGSYALSPTGRRAFDALPPQP